MQIISSPFLTSIHLIFSTINGKTSGWVKIVRLGESFQKVRIFSLDSISLIKNSTIYIKLIDTDSTHLIKLASKNILNYKLL